MRCVATCVGCHRQVAIEVYTAMLMRTPRRKLSRKKPSMGDRSMPPMAGMMPRNMLMYGSVSWKGEGQTHWSGGRG